MVANIGFTRSAVILIRDCKTMRKFFYRCRKYTGEIGVHDDPQVEYVKVNGATLEVVDKFCYCTR